MFYATAASFVLHLFMQASVAKLFKALHPLQKQVSFKLENVRTSINMQPLGNRQLDELAYATVERALVLRTAPAPATPAADISGVGKFATAP